MSNLFLFCAGIITGIRKKQRGGEERKKEWNY